ncbi:MAG: NUDIX hydrolase [Myxococcales bacterium]|nr:NUDIX hydrolase [Myxococcales bacterium]
MRYCPQCAEALTTTNLGGRDRLACPNPECNFVHWDNPTPVVAALVEHSDGVILIRNKGWPSSWLGLVSGFLERGEAPGEGCLREVQEELGLEGTVESLIGAYSFPRAHQIIIAYHIKVTGEVVLGDELEAYKIVPVEKLKPWPFGTGHAVADWLKSRKESD